MTRPDKYRMSPLTCKEFTEKCRNHCDFLVKEFGFKEGETEECVWYLRKEYKKEKVRVSVEVSPRDGGILVDFFHADKDIMRGAYSLRLRQVCEVRCHKEVPLITTKKEVGPDAAIFDKGLARRVVLIRKYALDVLEGDFSLLRKWRKLKNLN